MLRLRSEGLSRRQIATQVIAALRHCSFGALPELCEAIYQRMDEYNTSPFQKRAGSRLSVLEVISDSEL